MACRPRQILTTKPPAFTTNNCMRLNTAFGISKAICRSDRPSIGNPSTFRPLLSGVCRHPPLAVCLLRQQKPAPTTVWTTEMLPFTELADRPKPQQKTRPRKSSPPRRSSKNCATSKQLSNAIPSATITAAHTHSH